MWVVCLPFLSLGCCMLYSASVHFAAAACTAFVSKGVGVVVPLVVAVSFDVGKKKTGLLAMMLASALSFALAPVGDGEGGPSPATTSSTSTRSCLASRL